MAGPFWNVDECAEHLRIAKSSIYRWIHQRRIPHIKLAGDRVVFRPEEIEAWAATFARPVRTPHGTR